jgi:hypothetical protein
MFADHVPDAQLAQLKRLVRRLQRQQQQQQQQQGQGVEEGRGSGTKISTRWMGRALIRPPKVQQFEDKQHRRRSKQVVGNSRGVNSVQFTV